MRGKSLLGGGEFPQGLWEGRGSPRESIFFKIAPVFLPDKLVYFYTKNEKKPIFGLSWDYNIGHYLDFLPDNLIVFETWSKKCPKNSIYPKIAGGIGEVGIPPKNQREIA